MQWLHYAVSLETERLQRQFFTVYLRNHGGLHQKGAQEAKERGEIWIIVSLWSMRHGKELVISIRKEDFYTESWVSDLDSWVVCLRRNILRRAHIPSSKEKKAYDDFSVAILSLMWLYDFQAVLSSGTFIKRIQISAKTWEEILGKW